MKNLLFILFLFLSFAISANSQETFPQPSAGMLEQVSRLKAKHLMLVDYHIHLRGGMTADKAFDWEKKTGIISGVLENHGRDWPLSGNEKLAAFIKDARRFPLLVGIQVNDRDWFKTIPPELRKQLDYILADTMIMNDKNGKPQKLWLEEEYTVDNPDEWLERYYQHCLTVVNEPVTILANPTWLPQRMAKYYDKIWTSERQEKFIDAAIKNNVALEIQSPSEYPKPEFIKLAVKKGAKLSIGRNNHTDKPDELKRSLAMLEELGIKPENMLVLKRQPSPLETQLNPLTNPTFAELQKNFAAPHRDFSTGPLWTWNDLLTEEQVRGTLRDLAAQHIKQVWVHPRPGLMTPYLSDDWFAMWKAALDEGTKLDMNVWIYDENSYPSGFAGGFVPDAMPESRGQGLIFEEVEKLDTIDGNVRYVFDNDKKSCKNCHKNITDETLKAGKLPPHSDNKKYLIARTQLSPSNGWYAGKWYVDLLKKGVTEQFLDITLEAYTNVPEIRKEFGKRVRGIFTDEPHPAGAVSGFGLGGSGIVWNDEIPAAFEKKFGYSLIDNLPSLAKQTGEWKRLRHNYQQVILDLFIEHWSKPYFERCEKYGLEFTGHYWEHGWPGTSHGPDNMAMYVWHQRPAIDLLMNTYNDNSPNAQFGNVRSVKELASVANQMGHSRTLSENYGAGGWDLRFEDIKRLGDWSYALGVNTNNEHLSYVTIRGARKRDHPQSFSYHIPWFGQYHVLEDYFTRLSYVLSQGRQVNHILVIEPTTTAWMYQGTPELAKLGQSFTDLVNALEHNQAEYDLASEDIIKRISPGTNGDGEFVIGKALYDTIIIPEWFENIDANTLWLLKQFSENGGKIYRLGDLPSRIDGVKAKVDILCRAMTLSEVVRVAKERTAQTGLTVEVPEGCRSVFHHRRLIKDSEVLFVSNASLTDSVKITLNDLTKKKHFAFWNLHNGTNEYFGKVPDGKYEFTLPPAGSRLFVLHQSEVGDAVRQQSAKAADKPLSGSAATVKRLDDNVLTLDYVDVKVGNEEKKDVYTYQADKWIWQKNGFGKNPFDNEVQFKDELLKKTFPSGSGFSATYKFTLKDFVPKPLYFVMERPDLYNVVCNGKALTTPEHTQGNTPEFKDWYLDKSFGKFDISAAVKSGINEITLTANPLTVWTAVEPAYLLGDFAVKPVDKGFIVCQPETAAADKNDAPFYSGRTEYKRTFTVADTSKKHTVHFSDWLGAVAVVFVNGTKAETVYMQTNDVDVTNLLKTGGNEVSVVIYGTPKNTLGPHHAGKLRGSAWPNAFQKAPEHQPAGKDYDVIEYGLFGNFELSAE